MKLIIVVFVLIVFAVCFGYLRRAIQMRFAKLQQRCDVMWAEFSDSLRRYHDAADQLLLQLQETLPYESYAIEQAATACRQAELDLNNTAEIDLSLESDQTIATLIKSEVALQHTLGSLIQRIESTHEPQDTLESALDGTISQYQNSREAVIDANLAYNDVVMIFNAFRRSFPAVVFASSLGYRKDREQIDLKPDEATQPEPEYALA